MVGRLGGFPKGQNALIFAHKSPAINLPLSFSLAGLKPPSAALYVVELAFAGAFESHSPPHSEFTQLYVGV